VLSFNTDATSKNYNALQFFYQKSVDVSQLEMITHTMQHILSL